MNLPLILSLLLLGSVSSFHLKNEALELKTSEGEKTLTQELETSEEEENLATGGEEENDEEKEIAGDDGNLCPKEEDVVRGLGTPGCKTCRFLIVNRPTDFNSAEHICRHCYTGHLVSIHSYQTNYRIQCASNGYNLAQIWIGALSKGGTSAFWWIDGSGWTFSYWAAGQPGYGLDRCVALCTNGGLWHRAPCARYLPFACSY